MRDSVTVHMSATPAKVWDLVSDVTRIGEFSPETFDAKWDDGASGPAVGAKFRGHVKRNGRGPVYWTSCKVTECVSGELFTFEVLLGGKPVNTWSYALAAAGDGTDVTESFALDGNPGSRLYWAIAGKWRGRTNREGMRTTLERIRAVVEAA
jgi:Polyketide cyclase / dehydrase and lipid transport